MAEKKKYILSDNVYLNKKTIIDEALDTLYQITLVDEDCNVVYMNEQYSDFLGYRRSEVIGKPITDFISNSRLYETVESGEPKYNAIFSYEDGRELIYSKIPIKNLEGHTIGVASISAVDSTDTIHELSAELEKVRFANRMYEQRLKALQSAPSVFDSIVGESQAITEIKQTLNRVINSRLPILLTGESGTGKEVFANAIHNASEWKDAPFVRVNCAAIPKELLESELFGYEPGTFSGALQKGKAGKFELANNGTIMLDEISELPLDMQTKLLRVLQEYEVERIGSVKSTKLNIQVICCTNSNLYERVREGKFREDLLYRINVMEIEIPPLRSRKEDIDALAEALISRINMKYKINIKGISSEAIAYLKSYNWPGNVRELEHIIERACIIVRDRELIKKDFTFLEKKIIKGEGRFEQNADGSHSELERTEIVIAIKSASGNKKKAASLLKMSRSSLYNKIKEYGITAKDLE